MALSPRDMDPVLRKALSQNLPVDDKGVLSTGMSPDASRASWIAIGVACLGAVATLASLLGILVYASFGRAISASHFLFLFLSACAVWGGGTIWSYRYEKSAWFWPDYLYKFGASRSRLSVEAAYCNALAALLEQQKTLGHERAKRLLSDLNALLVGARSASERAKTTWPGTNGQPFPNHEQERAELVARLSATNDEMARETWAQTLAFHDERLERLRALEPVPEQAEAQIAAAIEAFRAVHTALVSLSLSPTTVTSSALPLELTGVTEAVQRLNGQARATEDAAREVGMLRIGR